MSSQKKNGAVAVIAAPFVIVALAASMLLLGGDDSDNGGCGPIAGGPRNPNSISIDPNTVPNKSIAGYGHEQLVNAAYVIEAGKALGLAVRDQTIGVMTAMGESSLRVIDYGDKAGPDSRGLFQQRANGAWGSYSDRMDPFISSTNFFRAMMKVPNRENKEPTIVAHETQINQDPYHYRKYWRAAVLVIEGLSGVDTGLPVPRETSKPNTDSGQTDAGGCSNNLQPGAVSEQGWAHPTIGGITSRFGPRAPIGTPGGTSGKFHSGTDMATPRGCDEPIWAVQDGTVTQAGFEGFSGAGNIIIDHGGGVETLYLHMPLDGVFPKAGDKVKSGQQIGLTGTTGISKGCHLHFMVQVNGERTNPELFMEKFGIDLGTLTKAPEGTVDES